MEKTFVNKGKTESNWILVDANEQNLGRMATKIASYLLGKHKPNFAPGVDMGDYVVVINAERLSFTQKRLEDKMYHHHSGFQGGLKSAKLKEMIEKHPDRVVRQAVWGMLPKTKFGRQILKRLKIYAGNAHPHQGQMPQVLD